jgi:hypothetical protein
MPIKTLLKENIVLVIGLSLPILLITLFFFASVLPKVTATPPQYPLLFSTTRYDYQSPPPYNLDFFVKEHRLTARVTKNKKETQNFNWRQVMVFDGKTQSVKELPYDISQIGDMPDSTELVFEEFKDLELDSSSKAPDGYEYDNSRRSSGGILLGIVGSSQRYSARVVKGAAAFKIPLNNGKDYYYYNTDFLGWVTNK